MEESGETTRPFRYDLSQIPYDYTMELTNRFKTDTVYSVYGEHFMQRWAH